MWYYRDKNVVVNYREIGSINLTISDINAMR